MSLPLDWPSEGAIEFDNVTLRYRPELPCALKGVSFKVRAGERVGLVGRTGSGKTTALACLFRLVPLEAGRVLIDGVDISAVPLPALRSRLAAIPQSPVIFEGTVRSNLDPFREHTDEALWELLTEVRLANCLQGGEGGGLGLETQVQQGGANFSQGQRQLFCLVRALLRPAKILVLDEPSASLDLASDEVIQECIRRRANTQTVLTIAHRLDTVATADRVIVMNDGEIVETGDPRELLADQNSLFSALVREQELHEQ